MKQAQLLLAYQRLIEKERELRDDIERTESLLAVNPNVVAAEEALARARSARETLQLRLRESDRDREAHRTRLHSRERELMSGRIRNPTELLQMSDEVAHMKAAFAAEEEAQLTLMEQAEAADESLRAAQSELAAAKREASEAEPELRAELDRSR